MKKSILLLLLFISVSAISQTVNDYKYLVVPVKFDFQNEINQYRLNTNTKFLLVNEGFNVFFNTDVLPMDLAKNQCNALYVEVVKHKAFMATRVSILFKDCQNNIVFSSEQGKSKEKKFEDAYNEALKKAMVSVKALNYKYNNTQQTEAVKEPEAAVAVQPVKQAAETPVVITDKTLFAQPTANGFQLIDNTPKIVLKLVKTSQTDYYMASGDNKQGVVYKKDGQWLFEYYENEKLVSEPLSIKF